jgi:hypothetical protein
MFRLELEETRDPLSLEASQDQESGAAQAAEKLVGAVILRSPALRDDLPAQAGEESRMFMKMRRARFFASLSRNSMNYSLQLSNLGRADRKAF